MEQMLVDFKTNVRVSVHTTTQRTWIDMNALKDGSKVVDGGGLTGPLFTTGAGCSFSFSNSFQFVESSQLKIDSPF